MFVSKRESLFCSSQLQGNVGPLQPELAPSQEKIEIQIFNVKSFTSQIPKNSKTKQIKF